MTVKTRLDLTTERAVNSTMTGPTFHIAPWGDLERAHGVPRAQRDAPVIQVQTVRAEADVDALCGEVIAIGGVFLASAASDRAVRTEPSRFELMPMCNDCVRAFATDKTDGTSPESVKGEPVG